MKAEIITSGTELLLGDVVDTNTAYLARELAAIGVGVYHHTTVGDNPDRLLEAIQLAETRANIIIVSGGLGPTQDDITKDILGKHLGVELVLDVDSFEKAKIRYGTEDISRGNYRQAHILEGSEPLTNDVGMAAGIFLERGDYTYVLLPGPPNEFEHMVSNYLLPKLSQAVEGENILRSRALNFYGIPEASVAERLNDIIQTQTNPTVAPYAKNGIIEVRLTASAVTSAACEQLLDEKEKEVLALIGEYFFSYGKTRLQDVVFEELTKQEESIALFEVLTGGATTDYWSRDLEHDDAFKGGQVFTALEHAKSVYGLTTEANKDEISTKAKQNEHYAKKIREIYQTDYGVAVTGWGLENLQEKEPNRVAWISIAMPNGELLTKKVDNSRSQNPARWLLSLRVSDVVRRVVLGLPELPERF